MKEVVSVNPFRCRMWSLHDRIESYVTEESCRDEINSFLKHGQMVTALGRRLKDDREFEIELIYGARRLFVARHLNIPLQVELRDMTDQQAVVAMDIENRHRQDVSPYERGRSFARWLQSGCFKSQEDISRALKISSPQVSRLLRIAQLPTVIVSAFPSPTEICERWGLRLMEALEEPERRKRTVERARTIACRSAKPTAEEVFHELITASATGRRIPNRTHDEVVKHPASGTPLFRIRQLRGSIALILPLKNVSSESLEAIQAVITDTLSASNETAGSPSALAKGRDRVLYGEKLQAAEF